ncbi:MAG: MIP/aquaporin family protein [Solirubrobacterales bacterium]|nr:aquaporin [Solirubrobacterales bacterium]
MQDRGLAAYIAELIGTLLLVFFITSVVSLYVATGQNPQFGSDFAVVGLTHFLVLFALIISIGVASGGHFNPAITAAFIAIRRIDPIDGLVYILAQLSGGVLGALLTKAFLLDEGRASDYGTPKISPLLGGAFQGFLVEGIGAFILVLTVLAVALNPETRRWAAISIGGALGMAVMVLGPLTGGSFNPARWFGPALVGNHFADAWVYIFGPLVGGLLAAVVYKFIIEPSSGPVQELADTVAPRGPAPPAGEAPGLRQSRGPGGPPPSSPPGGIAGT